MAQSPNVRLVTEAVLATKAVNLNHLLNSTFQINQRGYLTGGTLASGSYGFDRWKSAAAGSTLAFTASPAGQTVTINTGGVIEQAVEQGNLPAGTYVLSWVGTASARVYTTGETAPAFAASPVVVALSGAGDVRVQFTAVTGARTLANPKLESGSAATVFSRNGANAQAELAGCQRYYQRLGGNGSTNLVGVGYYTQTNAFGVIVFPAMRTAPSTSISDANGVVVYAGGTSLRSTIVNLAGAQPTSVEISIVTSGVAGLYAGWAKLENTISPYIELSAEL
ncbi:hypothetical protein E3T43_07085 [Cryobacterium sp. Hh7]|uniref:hypothetical protein n=1 Tax=Cryobacterium sp. Hh7 TaxID=1259159 RepID=UPI00106A29F8|nr:hypothetical protein [Cryobacterium sp. Hh7]TFD58006.1 hypothetical protein E3T43_07085 [Cryobacterium sp. Hh7]